MRKLQIIFIIIVLGIFFIPILKFNKNSTVSEEENRNLAVLPIFIKEYKINRKFFIDCDSYFEDRFGYRRELISLNNNLNKLIRKNNILVSSKAIQGKNGWFFYRAERNHEDFYKINLWDEKECSDFKDKIERISNWCDVQGIPYIFLICPNKHSVYEEYYPFDRPEGITRADQISKIFTELNVPYIFPRDFLISKKTEYDFPLYYETDTHWNSQGAYLAFTLLKKEIESFFPYTEFPQIEYEVKIEYSMTTGAILPMLSVTRSKCTLPRLSPAKHKDSDFYTYVKNAGRKGVYTKSGDERLPRALIFRDSFFTALEPFVSPLFSEAEYHWKQFSEEDKSYVLQYKPDIIIFEAVERCAPVIVN